MKDHIGPYLVLDIYGEVQGVLFRAVAKEIAEKLNIAGFAKNNKDGSVHIEAEGELKALEKFLEWSRRGPPLARVDRVDTNFGERVPQFSEFLIL